MKNVSIETQKGQGSAVKKSKVDAVSVYLGNALLVSVESFVERNQREDPIIIIYDGINPPNEVIMFEGTHSQLVDLLSRAQ